MTLYRSGYLPIKVEDPEAYHEFGRQVAERPEFAAEMISDYEYGFNRTTSVLSESPDERAAEVWLTRVRALHYDCGHDRP